LETREIMLLLPLWYGVFLLSLTAHEAAHALVARLGGDETAYLGGQVSLNPLPHVRREPFGTVVIPLMTFFLLQGQWMMGWASAPYDPSWEDRYPKRAAAMALAGPAANLFLAMIAFLALKLGLVSGYWEAMGGRIDQLVAPVVPGSGAADGLGRLLSILFGLNLLLFVFNMIPMPPMDGASVVSGFSKPARRMLAGLRRSPLGSMAGLLIAWYLLPFLFSPLYHAAVELLWS